MTAFLIIMTVFLLGATVYISTLLSSSNSPTQIQKTKAADVSYTREVNLFPTEMAEVSPTVIISPTTVVSASNMPTSIPTDVPTNSPELLAQASTVIPTIIPTTIPTVQPPTPTIVQPTDIPEPTMLPATPTLQPLLAYKSTSISPTIVPATNKGGEVTKAIQPTGIQQLPDTGWVQTSSILFIVATSTILFSLLF